MSDVITSATIARLHTSAEWINILHSVKTLASNVVSPSAPSSRQTDVTDAPCGRGGKAEDGGKDISSLSPSSERKGIEQFIIPGIGAW